MAYEKYHHSDFPHRKRHFFGLKSLIFLLFLGIIGYIFFTAVQKEEITGNFVKELDINNSFKVSLETTIPEISIKGSQPEVIIESTRNQEIILDGKRIILDRFYNSIVLREFEGEININSEELMIKSGKVSGVEINGIPIENNKDKKLRISLPPDFQYNALTIEEEAYIEKIEFVGSGRISFDENRIFFENEKVSLENLFGKIIIKDRKLNFDGLVKELEINFDDKVLSLKK